MIARTLILLIALSLFSGLSYAEYYKYRDKNGVLRFTDNILDVPKEQRDQLQAYKEVATVEESQEVPEAKTTTPTLNSRIDQLNSERELLAQEYNELEETRTDLLKEEPSPSDQEAYEAYRKRIESLNDKIKAYEEKRKLFQEKVDKLNAEIGNP